MEEYVERSIRKWFAQIITLLCDFRNIEKVFWKPSVLLVPLKKFPDINTGFVRRINRKPGEKAPNDIPLCVAEIVERRSGIRHLNLRNECIDPIVQ